MNQRPDRFRRAGVGTGAVILMMTSLVVVVLLFGLALRLCAKSFPAGDREVVRIYCAAGVANAIEQAIQAYRMISDDVIELTRTGGSGELLGQIRAERDNRVDFGADLFISADDRLLKHGRQQGLFADCHDLALERPVIAVRADSPIRIRNLGELVAAADTITFGIAHRSAAIGQLTQEIAKAQNLQVELLRGSKTEAENVMVLAQALAMGSLDAAIVWDATVHEINRHQAEPVLRIAARLDEQGTYQGQVAAGIVGTTRASRAAGDFVRFLRTPAGGGRFLAEAGFEVIDRP